MVRSIPAGVTAAAELTEAEGPEAGAVVTVRAGVVNLDVVRPRRWISRCTRGVMSGRRTVVFVHLGIVPPAADQALK